MVLLDLVGDGFDDRLDGRWRISWQWYCWHGAESAGGSDVAGLPVSDMMQRARSEMPDWCDQGRLAMSAGDSNGPGRAWADH
jgi:hypothetical protein